MNGPLKEAISVAGGQEALAAKIGVGQSLVSYWLKKAKKGVAPEFVPAIEALTGVPRHHLRPDVFGQSSLIQKQNPVFSGNAAVEFASAAEPILSFNEQSIEALDSTAARADASSPDPIADIAGSRPAFQDKVAG